MLDLVLMTMEEKMKKVKIEKKTRQWLFHHFSAICGHLKQPKVAKLTSYYYIHLWKYLAVIFYSKKLKYFADFSNDF